MQQSCRRCGAWIDPGAYACRNCGTPVSDNAPQSPFSPPGVPVETLQAPTQQGTNYGPYNQNHLAELDPYAAQYAPAPAPPPPVGMPSSLGMAPPVGMAPPGVVSPPLAKKKPSPALLVGGILAVVVLVALLGVGGYALFSKKGSQAPANPATLYEASLSSDPGGWACSSSQTCSFSSDGYHIQANQNSVFDSQLTKQAFDRLVIEVDGRIAQGDPQNAGLGIEFHVPQDNKAAGYGFFIYTDGSYALVKWDAQGNATQLITPTLSSAIHSGLQQQNHLKLVIQGGQFTFYVNDQQVAKSSDSTYSTGYIGLAAAGTGTETIFSHLLITKPGT